MLWRKHKSLVIVSGIFFLEENNLGIKHEGRPRDLVNDNAVENHVWSLLLPKSNHDATK